MSNQIEDDEIAEFLTKAANYDTPETTPEEIRDAWAKISAGE